MKRKARAILWAAWNSDLIPELSLSRVARRKQEIASFKRDYHGRDAGGILDAVAAQR